MKCKLDQYFTKPETAKHCYQVLLNHVDIQNHTFIEPSAGTGSFYDLLPSNSIGIDIDKFRDEYVQQDFLTWKPTDGKYVCIGNPPFGYRAKLALQFINHAAQFCEYIAFILPMSFTSDGKGNPKDRVVGMKLIHSEFLPPHSFMDINGTTIKINTAFRIWQRGDNVKNILPDLKEYIEIFTIDSNKNRLCGWNRVNEADWFLDRTFFSEPPVLTKSFSDFKYGCGYGLIFKKDKRKLFSILKNTDWTQYCYTATNNAKHISMRHIIQAVARVLKLEKEAND